MEQMEIECVYLRRRENQPDEYDRRKITCPRTERLLPFRNRVAELYQVPVNSIKLINRGKLIELNPILSLADVEIGDNSVVHVLDLIQKAPSMSRRRPQSAAAPFLPHSPSDMPNVIRMPSGRTLTELSVNRFCMNFVYAEPLCSLGELDTIIRTIAESFRHKYKVDVDVQRRNGQPYASDISFDVSFRAPPIMPSGAYNRYEAVKTLLIRQKLFLTIAEKHLIDQIQNPQAGTLPQNFDDIVLREIDRVERLELFDTNDYFSDDVSNDKIKEFVTKFQSDVEMDEVPLLGNVLQIRHLVPTDYYKILDLGQELDQEAFKLTNLQRELFNNDKNVDPKVADIFTVLLRHVHHLQAHIQHILSEISLRPNDSLRVAYPQGVLQTFSGLNPDITLTITFMASMSNRNIPTNEMNFGRFTSFHQVHLARPVLRANVAVEVEMGTVREGPRNAANGNQMQMRQRPVIRTRMPNATPYTRPRDPGFRGVNPPRPFTFASRFPSSTPQQFGTPSGSPRQSFGSLRPTLGSPRPSFVSPRQPMDSPRPPFLERMSMPHSPNSGGDETPQPRNLRDFLSALQGSQIQIDSQNGRPVTMNSNDALNPINSIFRAMDSSGGDISSGTNTTQEDDEGETAAIIIGSSDSNDSDAEDFARALQAAVASHRGTLSGALNSNANLGQGIHHHHMPPNAQNGPPQTFSLGPRIAMHQPQPHIHAPPSGGPHVHVQPMQHPQMNIETAQRQMRNLGPNGGCPIAYYERILPENLESFAQAQEISVVIPEMDLIPCIQRFSFERTVLRRNMNEFIATSLGGLEMIVKAYMQGIVSYNTGRQFSHPAIANEIASQGHRIQVRRPSSRDRVIEFYRLMGSQDLGFMKQTFTTNTFLEARGFLGNIVLTLLNSIEFENLPNLLLNPFDLGILRSGIKKYVMNKFKSDDVGKIIFDLEENSFGHYHYLMGVQPFGLARDGKDMVGSLRKMDKEMLQDFYHLVFQESSDEQFGKAFMDLIRTYHSALISFCYIASNGFSHAHREFLRHIFLDYPSANHQQTDFAMDVFMESLVNLGLSFDNPENLTSIKTENVSSYLLATGASATTATPSLGSIGDAFQSTRTIDIDTTTTPSRAPLLPKELLEDDLE